MTRYTYRCGSCGGSVTKEALVKGGTGLGTWRCLSGCPKRRFSTKRDQSGGKEKGTTESAYPVRRATAVKRTMEATS